MIHDMKNDHNSSISILCFIMLSVFLIFCLNFDSSAAKLKI